MALRASRRSLSVRECWRSSHTVLTRFDYKPSYCQSCMEGAGPKSLRQLMVDITYVQHHCSAILWWKHVDYISDALKETHDCWWRFHEQGVIVPIKMIYWLGESSAFYRCSINSKNSNKTLSWWFARGCQDYFPNLRGVESVWLPFYDLMMCFWSVNSGVFIG